MLAGDGTHRVLPDERGRMAGRGAHLHPTVECLERAERRRVFAGALRVSGPVDLSVLRRHVEQHGARPTDAVGTTGGSS